MSAKSQHNRDVRRGSSIFHPSILAISIRLILIAVKRSSGFLIVSGPFVLSRLSQDQEDQPPTLTILPDRKTGVKSDFTNSCTLVHTYPLTVVTDFERVGGVTHCVKKKNVVSRVRKKRYLPG